jgi:hypothetical protein
MNVLDNNGLFDYINAVEDQAVHVMAEDETGIFRFPSVWSMPRETNRQAVKIFT